MLLTELTFVRDVILFPLLRPESKDEPKDGAPPRGGRRRGRAARQRPPAKTPWKFAWFVARRYLRSPHRPAVLRLITLLATLGVAAGGRHAGGALAMNSGFRHTFQDRLLGVTAQRQSFATRLRRNR